MKDEFLLKNLHVKIEDKEILKGIDLEIKFGEIHAIMGPNGSGKSTLANVIMGHPKYEIIEGDIIYCGKSIREMKTYERAQMGIFLAFQYPLEIPGVVMSRFLWTAISNLRRKSNDSYPKDLISFNKELREIFKQLKMNSEFSRRHLNVGFSGGEKKRAEIAQLLILKPSLIIMDEIDSGLDIDSIKIVAEAINSIKAPSRSLIVITHYPRILYYLNPDYVHVLIEGRIVKSGNMSLAKELEEKGYEKFQN